MNDLRRLARTILLCAPLTLGLSLTACTPPGGATVDGESNLREDMRRMITTAKDRVYPALVNIRVITVYPRLTATAFGKNSLGNQWMRQGQRGHGAPLGAPAGMPTADTAEFVAERILDAAQREPADQFMDA